MEVQKKLDTQSVTEDSPQDRFLQLDRRSRVETYCDVLYAIGSGAEKPTHIMYKANLSWNVLDNHIEKLLKKGLVVSEKGASRERFHLTEKGFRVLKQFIVLRQELDLSSDENE